MRKVLLTLLSILASTTLTIAREYDFLHYNSSDGLCHQTVRCALQDEKGFLWFGTKSGLSRYDGHRFINYYHEQDNAHSLPDNSISDLARGANGEIWICTGSGLVWFAPEKEQFSLYRNNNGTLNASRIRTDEEGNIWAFDGETINIVNASSKKNISTFTLDDSYSPASPGFVGGSLWLSSANGFIANISDRGSLQCRYKVLTDEEIRKRVAITSVHTAKDGNLIVFTNNSGIRQVNTITSEVTVIHDNSPEEKNEYVFTTLRYSDNEIWAGTETGIYIFDIQQSGYTIHLTKSLLNARSLSDNAIHVLLKDNENGVWCGSFFNGLNYLPNDENRIQTFFPTDTECNITANVIRDIVPYDNGLITGTEDGGLFFFNKEDHSFYPMNIRWESNDVPSNIQSLLLVDENTLWVGTFDSGVYVTDLESRKITDRFNRNNPGCGIPNIIVSLVRTTTGKILVGTHLGLFVYEKAARHFSKLNGVSTMVKDIVEDNDGTVWICTQREGLFKIAGKDIGPDGILTKSAFPYKMVTSAFEDSSQNFYVTTEGEGCYLFDRVKGTVSPVIDPKDYPGAIVYRMTEDRSGQIWISSSIGLFKLNREKDIESLITTSNGLATNQFNYNSSYMDTNGDIYFGSVMGLVALNLNNCSDDTDNVNVYITTVTTPGYHSSNPIVSGNIRMKANQNNLAITYAVPSYSSSRQIWYRYRLEGIDSQWTITQSPDIIQYTGLSAGKYHFTVQASTDRHNWASEAVYDITVMRPHWRSVVALLIYMTCVLLCLYCIIREKIKSRKEEEHLRMENLKAEKDKESMEAMINFFTNITHEIRTPLTIISGTLDRIRKGGMTKDLTKKDLQIMTRHTQRLEDLVNQILDFRKIESSSIHLSFERVNMGRHLKELFNSFSPLALSKKVRYCLKMEEGDYWTMADTDALTKIISNLLSNALKFCDTTVNVMLGTENDGGNAMLVIRVENDGDLIPDSAAKDIFKPFYQYKAPSNLSTGSGLGLPLAKSLAELMDGQLFYNLEENRQTNCFILKLPANTPVENNTAANEERYVQPKEIIRRREYYDETESQKNGTVLVVDDEEDMRHLLYEELSGKYNVLTAESVKKALEVLDEHIVSLIISDIMMPVTDGLEFCREIKSNIKYSHIPVIMLTAKVSMQSHIDALESKADAFIEKPFSYDHLTAMISNLLTNRELIHSTFIHSPYAHMSSIAYNKVDEKFLETLNSFIMSNLSNKDLSVERLAEHMTMSVSSFYRKVKLTTSITPVEFIRLCRLKKAAELLSSGEYRVNEVSENVGFSSQSRFASYFMKQFGMTPSQFIKNLDKR